MKAALALLVLLLPAACSGADEHEDVDQTEQAVKKCTDSLTCSPPATQPPAHCGYWQFSSAAHNNGCVSCLWRASVCNWVTQLTTKCSTCEGSQCVHTPGSCQPSPWPCMYWTCSSQ